MRDGEFDLLPRERLAKRRHQRAEGPVRAAMVADAHPVGRRLSRGEIAVAEVWRDHRESGLDSRRPAAVAAVTRGTGELIDLASGARLAQGVERVPECADSDKEPRDAKVHHPPPDPERPR